MGNYIPVTPREKRLMEDFVGINDTDELFDELPEGVRLKNGLQLPEGLSESEVLDFMCQMAAKNTVFKSIFRGAGIYNHYIPAIVEYITSKEEFVTAYTPYQPEISQGILQSIYEYQTMICELTGMDVSNASVYDGATANAEAVKMCTGKGRDSVVLSEGLDPQIIEVIETYCFGSGTKVVKLPLLNGRTDIDALKLVLNSTTAAVCISQPNFLGQIEDAYEIGEIAHAADSKLIMNCNPLAMTILASPAECKADIAVGDGQTLGLPMSFGGPTFGFMACTTVMMRTLPGRIAGETTDSEGNRAFVLTLQAREQHIRREKSSSNICSNQSLCAMTAAVHISTMGPEGLRNAAVISMSKAHYLQKCLSKLKGFETIIQGEFFNEFVTESPIPPEELNSKLAQRGILGGLELQGELKGCILWCATEKNTRGEIDALIETIKEVCGI